MFPHSLIVVGAVGVRVPLYPGHIGAADESGAHPSPFAALSLYLIRKRYPFAVGLAERISSFNLRTKVLHGPIARPANVG